MTYPPDYDFDRWVSRLQDSKETLARLLGRDADLVMTAALRNP